jgi:hypothetical protein
VNKQLCEYSNLEGENEAHHPFHEVHIGFSVATSLSHALSAAAAFTVLSSVTPIERNASNTPLAGWTYQSPNT